MPYWLVCKECGVKEWVQDTTKFVHCPTCREPRYGEDDEGKPVVFFSQPLDPEKW